MGLRYLLALDIILTRHNSYSTYPSTLLVCLIFFLTFVLNSLAYLCLSVSESFAVNVKTLQEVKIFLPLWLSSVEHDTMPHGFFCIYSVQLDSQISFLNVTVMPLAVWPHTGTLLEFVWKLRLGINAEPQPQTTQIFP